MYGEEAENQMISCYKLIFDTHYLMRKLLMAEQCQRSHSRRSCCKTYPFCTHPIQTKCSKLFEMMTYQLAFAYKNIWNFRYVSYPSSHHTFWWGKFIQVMFRLTFEVGWWKCNFTLALNATLKSFNCECQPKMNVRVSLLCFLVVPGHFRKSKLCEWPNKLHFD